MKTRLIMTASMLITSLVCLPASAQSGPGATASPSAVTMGNGAQQAGGPGTRGPRDCAQTQNPEACTAHRAVRAQANEACKGQAEPERKQCLIDQRQNFDCSKAANPQQCAARKAAYKECQSHTGPAFRQCVQQKMPAPDCSKSKDTKRCETRQNAREACKEKIGPEHKNCLREQLNLKRSSTG